MVAELKLVQPPLEAAVEVEYSVIARKYGNHLMGVEKGHERAMAVAAGLALGGWRVEVRCIDPLIENPLVWEVWSEDAQ